MEITEYLHPSLEEALPLYAAVGWTNYTRSPNMVEAALGGALCTLAAREDNRLIGLIRAVGDGASILYVQDIIVLPPYQRQGVGTALLRALLARYPHVYQTVLLTDDTPKTAAFYQSCGLTPADQIGCAAFVRIKPGP